MKKIIILLVILTLASCQSERVVVKVTVKTLTEDINESIVDGFYNGDTTGLVAKGILIK
jgi:hypothetical protein